MPLSPLTIYRLALLCVSMALGLAAGPSACSSSNLPSAFGGKNVSWSVSEAGEEPTPGIDTASVVFGVWGEGAAIAVWSDRGTTTFGGGGMGGRRLQPGETRRGVKYEGRISTPDGRIVRLECYTPDGKSGTVRIAESTHELVDGALFLISTRGPGIRVQQLDLARLNPDPGKALIVDEISREWLEERAEADPEIRAFFTSAGESDQLERSS